MVLAVHEGHKMNRKGVVKYLILTIIGGLIFLGSQAWEWTHLFHEGAWWGRNPFPIMTAPSAQQTLQTSFLR